MRKEGQLTRFAPEKKGREKKREEQETQTYSQQNAKPLKLYMFDTRNIDNGRRSGLGFGSPGEDLFPKALEQGRLFHLHSQKEEDRKLVMEKERIRWRRKGGGYTFLESVVRRRFDDIQY